MTSRRAAAAIGVLVLMGTAQAQTLETLPLSRSTEAGAETVIAFGRHWNTKPCVPLRTTILVMQPPAHGTVRIVDVLTQVPDTTRRGGSTGYCAGMLLYGKEILYRSEPGFEGTDTMSYESVGSNGRRAPYIVTISVAAPD